MTREEKIKGLYSLKEYLTENPIELEGHKSLPITLIDYAIEALEQEPTTKNCESCRYYGSHHEVCNYCYNFSLWTEVEPTTKKDLGVDAVSRQAVLYLIADDDLSMGQVVRGIHALPSVTPQEPKTGHWMANAPQYDMLNPQYICSECGNAHTRTTPYCEMCGAKMVEPQESEDKE